MKYTDLVLKHPIFTEFVEEIHMAEAFRIYCGHEIDHAMEVARLSWIYYLEESLKEGELQGWSSDLEETKDLFYVAALLHDIGRVAQYETGVHHAIAGIKPAKQILADIQAPLEWVDQILEVIAEHSDKTAQPSDKATGYPVKNLQYYIAKADHDCRLCFSCLAADSCKWTQEQRNQTIHS